MEESEARLRKTEKLLRESEERFRLLYENAPLAYQSLDENGCFLETNQAWADLLGYGREAVIGKWCGDFLNGSCRDKFKVYFPQFKAVGEVHGVEFEMVKKDGSLITVAADGRIGHDEYGRFRQTHCILHDITEQKRAEEKNLLLAAIVESSDDAIFGKSLDGTITSWNKGAANIYGYKEHEVVGKPITVLIPPDRQEEVPALLASIRRGKHVEHYETVRRKRDGRHIDMSLTISPIRNAEGSIIGASTIARDITEQKSLQRQLLQAQKMEAIGTLAGGIAHDFNNLLQVVIGYSDMLLFDKNPTDREYEGLHAIRQAGREGSELTKRILAFSRRLEPNARPLNLNNEINRIERMLRRTVPRMIRIELHLGDELMTVNADPGQMEQILLNLAVNAQHAMSDGGRLTIGTENVTLDEDYSRTHLDVEPGAYVLVTVSDTGHGMDKEVLEHIFEPFYTTKGPVEGTGLGLAMVFGIVKSHKGHITCYSEPGQGTTFKMYLPAIIQEIETDLAVTQQIPAFGTETILLVDDEKSIRKVGEQMLKMAGYRVLTATNGREALEIYRSNKGSIALVILDLIMPEMGGKQCLEELLKISPKAKVVIASGYSAHGPTKGALASGARGFVNKPYGMRQVLEVIRRVLDEE